MVPLTSFVPPCNLTTIRCNFTLWRPIADDDQVPPGVASCHLQRSRQRRLSGPSDRPDIITTIRPHRALLTGTRAVCRGPTEIFYRNLFRQLSRPSCRSGVITTVSSQTSFWPQRAPRSTCQRYRAFLAPASPGAMSTISRFSGSLISPSVGKVSLQRPFPRPAPAGQP